MREGGREIEGERERDRGRERETAYGILQASRSERERLRNVVGERNSVLVNLAETFTF